MGWEAWATLVVMIGVLVSLLRGWAGPDVVLVGAVTLLMTLGLFTDHLPGPAALVAGFGNAGLITVAALFVVAAGLTQTGATQMLARPMLGQPTGVRRAQARLMLPVIGLSAFLNNTPIVAMLLPVVSEWARKIGVSPSKLFLPLSYAAILGGMCTLIGTSTNLLVYGLLLKDGLVGGDEPIVGLFTVGAIGLPVAVLAVGYALFASRWLLPDRAPALNVDDAELRRYTVAMVVESAGPLVGKSIEAAGLRRLPGLFLAEIERGRQIMPAVSPETVLEADDRLVFVGVVESVNDLRKVRGLSPATDQVFKLAGPHGSRRLIEAVVSAGSPVLHQSIRDARFRSRYNAAVIAVARDGQRVTGKIGDIVLRPADVLLLEAPANFVEAQRNRRDFYLVRTVNDSTPPRHDRAGWALAILAGFVLVVAMGWVQPLHAALLAVAGMGAAHCLGASAARQAIDGRVIIVIGAALGLGLCVQESGLARGIADGVVSLIGGHPWLALLAVYLLTNLFTEMITNNAAAVLIYPIAKTLADDLSLSFTPFVIVIMIAASASFATPIGYQTNLMVYGPGGYRFSDYLKFGGPLNVMVAVVTLALTPWFFPLELGG